jgi:hypothetical protein
VDAEIFNANVDVVVQSARGVLRPSSAIGMVADKPAGADCVCDMAH